MGYGLLRWMGEDETAKALATAPVPAIAFNYLGQVDGSFKAEGPFTLAPEAVGDTIDPQAHRRHAVELVAAVVGGRLTLRWIHVPGLHTSGTIEALAQRFAAAVERLVAVEEAEARAAWTPSDFPLAGFDSSASGLQALAATLGDTDIIDLYPLTPAQEGMLFHTVKLLSRN